MLSLYRNRINMKFTYGKHSAIFLCSIFIFLLLSNVFFFTHLYFLWARKNMIFFITKYSPRMYKLLSGHVWEFKPNTHSCTWPISMQIIMIIKFTSIVNFVMFVLSTGKLLQVSLWCALNCSSTTSLNLLLIYLGGKWLTSFSTP